MLKKGACGLPAALPPVVYQNGLRLGEATLLDMLANDRRPDLGDDF